MLNFISIKALKSKQILSKSQVKTFSLVNAKITYRFHSTDGFTPLHLAANKGHYEIAELLLQNGAKVNAKGKKEVTPLHLAAQKGHYEVAELLLQNGAKVNAKKEFEKYTPLHEAIRLNHSKVVELLLENGADVNARDQDGNIPLHLPAARGDSKMVELLLKHGSRKDVKNYKGRTPQDSAGFYYSKGNQDVVALLENN